MDYIQRAKELRPLIEKASAYLSDEDAFYGTELFPRWHDDSRNYPIGKRVCYNGKLYKCIQAHTSQSSWNPADAVSLWVEIPDPSIEFPEWKQPTGAHDAYNTGDKVSHLNKHWISTINANVYEPGVYGWNEV